MAGIEYSVEKELAVLSSKSGGWNKEFNLVSWNNRTAKYDIREWSPEHDKMGKGVTLSVDEAKKLYEALKIEFGEGTSQAPMMDQDLLNKILEMAKD